jgi:hypothetical protein
MVGQEATQERQMRFTPFGYPLVIVVVRYGAAHDQEQDLWQRMRYAPLLPRIVNEGKMVQ